MNKTDVVITKPLLLTEEVKCNSGELMNLSLEKYLEMGLNSTQMCKKIKNEMIVLVNGIEINLNTPILFLYFNFSYMDTFLYITINQ